MSGNQVGCRTLDGGKSKNNMSTPQWGGHNESNGEKKFQIGAGMGVLDILTGAVWLF